jgi:enamine deaminase RidA (YjgF/YER057c/UK114 family)
MVALTLASLAQQHQLAVLMTMVCETPMCACETATVTDGTPVELIRSPELAGDVSYAYAAVPREVSRLVFTAGACPLDQTGATVAICDIRGQAEQVMLNLSTALHDAGVELNHVVKTSVYVASQSRADLVAAWEVVAAHFGDHDAPSTLLGVTVLGYPDQLVEVEAIAAVQ